MHDNADSITATILVTLRPPWPAVQFLYSTLPLPVTVQLEGKRTRELLKVELPWSNSGSRRLPQVHRAFGQEETRLSLRGVQERRRLLRELSLSSSKRLIVEEISQCDCMGCRCQSHTMIWPAGSLVTAVSAFGCAQSLYAIAVIFDTV